jgi:hypothetical protein
MAINADAKRSYLQWAKLKESFKIGCRRAEGGTRDKGRN